MIAGHSVLALITARGGSKGLPGKNIAPVLGRPLIDFSIAAARAARGIDRVVLSTDDESIAAVARSAGCEVPFMRPAHLATDRASSMDVVLHALDTLPAFDLVVLLQPTSPARSAQDIEAACALLLRHQASTCVSVTLAEQSPYWMFNLGSDDRLQALIPAPAATRRQDLPPTYLLNGAVYVARCEPLRRQRSFVAPDTVAYVMPPERSIDIDTASDLDAFVRQLSKGNS